MKCKDFDHISFREKLYGREKMEKIKQHLMVCMKCQQKFTQSEAMIDLLGSYWLSTRESCLSTEQLQRYVDGKTKGKEKALFERHLSVCSYCMREMQLLKEVTLGTFKVLSMDKSFATTSELAPDRFRVTTAEKPVKRTPLDFPPLLVKEDRLISKDFLRGKKPKKTKDKKISPSQFLKKLEDGLKKEIVHQEHVIKSLVTAVKVSKWGLETQGKPRGIFLFMGPTGTGKTFTAKKFAEHLFGDASHLVHENLGYYNSPSDVARLFGSAPGYIGYGEKNNFLSRVKEMGEGVILLDEMEKANPIIWDTFLGIFDEGRARSAAGEEVDFTNFFIIMTSNAGAEVFGEKGKIGFISAGEGEISKNSILKILQDTYLFKPEFLSRIDHFCLFNPLTINVIEKLISLELKKFGKLLKQKESKKLSFTKPFVKEFSHCVSHELDARQVFRTINVMIKQPVLNLKFDDEKSWKKIEEIILEPSVRQKKNEMLMLNLAIFEEGDRIESFIRKIFPNITISKNKNTQKIEELSLQTKADVVIVNMSLLKDNENELFEIYEKLKNKSPQTELAIIVDKDMGQDFVLRCTRTGISDYLTPNIFRKEIMRILDNIWNRKIESLSRVHQSGTFSLSKEGKVLRYSFNVGFD